MDTVLIENKEQFKKYVHREVCNNMLLLPPKYDTLFVDLLTKAFEVGMIIGMGKTVTLEVTG